MTEESDLSKIRQTLQDLKDSQDMVFSWVKGIDDNVTAKFAELDDMDAYLIEIQRHEYQLLKKEIEDVRQKLPPE